jgi:hypothetical protein
MRSPDRCNYSLEPHKWHRRKIQVSKHLPHKTRNCLGCSRNHCSRFRLCRIYTQCRYLDNTFGCSCHSMCRHSMLGSVRSSYHNSRSSHFHSMSLSHPRDNNNAYSCRRRKPCSGRPRNSGTHSVRSMTLRNIFCSSRSNAHCNRSRLRNSSNARSREAHRCNIVCPEGSIYCHSRNRPENSSARRGNRSSPENRSNSHGNRTRKCRTGICSRKIREGKPYSFRCRTAAGSHDNRRKNTPCNTADRSNTAPDYIPLRQLQMHPATKTFFNRLLLQITSWFV